MPMHLREMKQKKAEDLAKMAEELGVEDVPNLRKQELMFAILSKLPQDKEVVADGVLEVLQDGFGFLRSVESSCMDTMTPRY